MPQKRNGRWLARPRKRHYTFARRLDHVTAIRVTVRRHRPFKALICRVYLFYICSETAAPRPHRSRRGLNFRSLRLSVRTPPFHGGESGSIPLGSAKHRFRIGLHLNSRLPDQLPPHGASIA